MMIYFYEYICRCGICGKEKTLTSSDRDKLGAVIHKMCEKCEEMEQYLKRTKYFEGQLE